MEPRLSKLFFSSLVGSLSLVMAAAAQNQAPPKGSNGPGSDAVCMAGANGNHGAIASSVAEPLENGEVVDPDSVFIDKVPDEVQKSIPLIEGGPGRVYGQSDVVNTLGDLRYVIPLGSTTSINGDRMRINLVYRSDETAGGRVPDSLLSTRWHLDCLENVHLTVDDESTTALRWLTGTGDTHYYNTKSTTFAASEEWWSYPGVAYSQFRWYTHSTLGLILERYIPDGHVMRYERIGSGHTTGDYRPSKLFDRFDNAYTYAYDSNGRVATITDPRGFVVTFTWDTSNQKCTITYSRGTQNFSCLTTVFKWNSSSHVSEIDYPQSKYIAGSGPLLDISSPTTNARGLVFGYNSSTNYLLESMSEFRGTSGSNVRTMWTVTWTSAGSRERVESMVDVYGMKQVWGWTCSGTTLTSFSWREPYLTSLGTPPTTTHTYVVDAYSRVTSEVVAPGSSGTPRSSNTPADSPGEPTSLTYSYTYGSCVCPKPTQVQTPSGAQFNMTWDSESGKLLTLQRLDPSAPDNTTTVTDQWTWKTFLEQSLPATFVPPSGATLTYTYNLINRTDGLAGKKIDYYKVETSTINQPDSSTHTIKIEVWMDSYGRPTTFKDPGCTTYTAAYNTTTATNGYYLASVTRGDPSSSPSTALQTTYSTHDLGWLTGVSVGGTGSSVLSVSYTLDSLGRREVVTASPGSGKPSSIRELYRDRYGNVVVERVKNLDSAGNAPKYEDTSGGGRTWVRNEWHYDYDKLTESYVDRRSLADGEGSASTPDSGTNPWMVKYAYGYRSDDGTLETVTTPNGAVAKYEVDGYGMLYRIIGDYGTSSATELGRAYYDADLVLKETRRKRDSSNWSSWTVSRSHVVSGVARGYPYKTQDPTGVVTTLLFDSLGRVSQRTMQNGTSAIERKTTFDYDEVGRLTGSHGWLLTSGSGSAVSNLTWIYNKRSQVVESRSDLGRKSFREYDAVGRLLRARDNRSSTTTQCDEIELAYLTGRDLVLSVTAKIWEDTPSSPSRKDYVTIYTRDLFGRVTQSEYKGLNGSQTSITRSFAYDTLGNLTQFTDPNNHLRRAVFDADGRPVRSVLRESSSASSWIEMMAEYSDNASSSRTTVVKKTDGKGFVTRHEYDPLYRLSRMELPGFLLDPSGSAHRSLYAYDSNSGRLSTVTDGNDTVVTHSYDYAGRMTQRAVSIASGAPVSTLATKEVFAYDPLGFLNRIETDQGTGGSTFLAAVDITMDTLNRTTKESFTYWGISTSYPVDVQSGFTFSSGGGTADDPLFRRSLTYPSGVVVGTTPDAIGRMDTVTLTPAGGSQATLATYKWAGSLPLQRTLNYVGSSPSHSQTTTFGYDYYRRLVSLSDTREGSPTPPPFSAFSFSWDAAGNLLNEGYTKKVAGVGDRFDYDAYNRVMGAKMGAADLTTAYASVSSAKEIAYSLDAGNNRTSVVDGGTTISYALENDGGSSPTDYSYRYSSVTTGADVVTPLYDNEGNLTYDGHFYYVYDFKNRLSEVWVATEGSPSSSLVLQQQTKKSKPVKVSKKNLAAARKTVLDRFSGSFADILKAAKKLKQQKDLETQGTTLTSETFTLSLMAAYGYDPMNRRVIRLAITSDFFADHRYAYDGWREVEELTPVLVSGSTYRADAQKSFVWGSRIDELLSYRKLDGTTWVPYYLTQGKLDNVVALQSSGGTMVESVEYDPYGKASVFVGSSTTPQELSSVDNPYLFQGRRLDVETRFLYFRNRYLSTDWGRFLTNDPIGVWGDVGNLGNGVAFVGNASSVGGDPLGLHIGLPSTSGGDSGNGGIGGYDAVGGPGPTGDLSNVPPGVLASTGPGTGGSGGSCGGGVNRPNPIPPVPALLGVAGIYGSTIWSPDGGSSTITAPFIVGGLGTDTFEVVRERNAQTGEWGPVIRSFPTGFTFSYSAATNQGALIDGSQVPGGFDYGIGENGQAFQDWVDGLQAVTDAARERAKSNWENAAAALAMVMGGGRSSRASMFSRSCSCQASRAGWRSLAERIADFKTNPNNWQRTAASIERSTGKASKGGVSVESTYTNTSTGETLHVHDVFKPSGGQIPNHPTFREYGKGGR